MPLKLRLQEYVRACFSGIWIESHEHEDALLEIAELCREEEWQLLNWDIDAGLKTASGSGAESGSDPLAAIRAAAQTGDNTTVLVLRNFHRFMQSPEIVQALANQVVLGKQQRTFFVVLSPVVQIPIELEKLFVVIEHQLPSRSLEMGEQKGPTWAGKSDPPGKRTGQRLGSENRPTWGMGSCSEPQGAAAWHRSLAGLNETHALQRPS